jgi:hypothetical protein
MTKPTIIKRKLATNPLFASNDPKTNNLAWIAKQTPLTQQEINSIIKHHNLRMDDTILVPKVRAGDMLEPFLLISRSLQLQLVIDWMDDRRHGSQQKWDDFLYDTFSGDEDEDVSQVVNQPELSEDPV